MLQLSELTNQTRDAEIEIAGEKFSVTFYAHSSPSMRLEALKEGRITQEEYEAISSRDASLDVAVPVAIAARVRSWTLEVVNGHGPERPPVTSGLLSLFKDEHLGALYKVIFGGTGEVPTDADDSPNG